MDGTMMENKPHRMTTENSGLLMNSTCCMNSAWQRSNIMAVCDNDGVQGERRSTGRAGTFAVKLLKLVVFFQLRRRVIRLFGLLYRLGRRRVCHVAPLPAAAGTACCRQLCELRASYDLTLG